jgi:hypothetical protein
MAVNTSPALLPGEKPQSRRGRGGRRRRDYALLDPVRQPHRRRGVRGLDADEDADDGDERDRRRGQHRRRHDVVPQGLDGQHAVLLRVLVQHASTQDKLSQNSQM